ncbi:hypothetical protein EXIGLDRAFT_828262 [Exidia glandulosa HHB12029]|uniref:Uncharacterized protein n=1 Tax=Exidia glandulosa HHB12029 TaxID=1314781 RepID=A0A165R1Z1_EXIGL|nr:hypothetical protein EXIGLDRAFT_828262 [Exidia glandulosa HHB12029]
MKSLRRSLVNKDPPAGNVRISTPLSLPSVSKPPSALLPPSKVIKAVQSYRSQAPQELSFTKGDFFHVIRDVDRGASQWYEAHNPMSGARGLVPRNMFEEFGKANAAQSIGTVAAGPRNALSMPAAPRPGAGQPPSPQGKQTYYAIVMHDFAAERPDELDARAGEAITIVAQSNREWFVGKPIGKLGRPGLIPISFVEMRDPATGQPVDDIMALLDRGEIPLVEEWKKAMNQYKAASIPLGVIDDPSYGPVPNSPFAPQGPQSRDSNGNPAPYPSPPSSVGPPEPLQSEPVPPPQMEAPQEDSPTSLLPEGILFSADVGSFHFENGEYWFRINAVFQPEDPNGGDPLPALQLVLFRVYDDFYDFQITLLDTFPVEAGRAPPPNNPDQPPSRILPYMPGPVPSVDAIITAERCTELDEYVRNLTMLRDIGAEHILRHELMRSFFSPRSGDAEVEIDPVLQPPEVGLQEEEEQYADQMRALSVADRQTEEERGYDDRYYDDQGYGGRSSQYEQDQGYGRSSQYERQDGYGRSSGHERAPSRSNGARSRQDSQPRMPSPSSLQRGSSPMPPNARQQAAEQSQWDGYSQYSEGNTNGYGGSVRPTSRTSGSNLNAPPISNSNPQAAYVKIKIFNRGSDDLIAIRVPPRVTHRQLLDKVRERLGNNVTALRYRNSMTGQFDELEEDELHHWLDTADKLVLYAN